MNRLKRALPLTVAGIAVAIGASACGTQKISVPSNDPTAKQDVAAAHIFNQRCGGCHSLAQAGTFGSGQNPRTYEAINGPNFNVRCEKPAVRVLYAIENGGFSGAYMPQNVVVGQQARDVAMFVSKFSGQKAPSQPGIPPCSSKSAGALPEPGQPVTPAAAGVTPKMAKAAKKSAAKAAAGAPGAGAGAKTAAAGKHKKKG